MYHVEYSWRNLKRSKTLKWIQRHIHLLLALFWIALIPFALTIWQQSILFVIVMSLYANIEASFAAREAAKDNTEAHKTLTLLREREEKEEDLISEILSTNQEVKEYIMALGRETQSALTELREAIATEADQAVQKIVELTSADADTAAAIREAVAGVKGIIPDAVEDVDIPTADTPADEPSEEPAPEVPADEPVAPVEDTPVAEDPAPVEDPAPAPSDVPGENPAVVEDEARTEE